MKKLLLVLLSLSLCCSACGKKTEEAATDGAKSEAAKTNVVTPEAAELLKSVEFTKDGLIGMVKAEDAISPVELEALVLSYEKCKPLENKLKSGTYAYDKTCPADEAWNALNKKIKNMLKPKENQTVLMRLIQHENGQVRDKAYHGLDPFTQTENKKALLDALMAEKDPIVAANFLQRYLPGKSRITDQDDIDLVKAKAKDESPFVRKAVVAFLDDKNKGNKEFNDLMLDLCKNDSAQEVKNEACGRIVKFDVPDKMKLAEELLKDRSKVEMHDLLLSNLCRMWDPSDKVYDADAYKLWMDYLKVKPRSKDMAWRIFSNAFSVSDEWRQKATYYDEKEFLDLMMDVATDVDAKDFVRTGAIDMIALFGGKEKGLPLLQDLQSKLENDKSANMVKPSLQKKIDKLSK